MKKRSYRAQKVNEIQWEEITQSVQDKAMVLAIECGQGGTVWRLDGQ
jgi:hypothetical protein